MSRAADDLEDPAPEGPAAVPRVVGRTCGGGAGEEGEREEGVGGDGGWIWEGGGKEGKIGGGE